MGQLHELLAVEGNLNRTAGNILEETKNTFLKKPDTFRGLTASLTMLQEGRSAEDHTNTKEVVDTVPSKLDYASQHTMKYWNAMLQKEEANQRAMADLIVDGQLIMANVPATFLLGLETRLTAFREVLMAAPTLDPNLTWSEDPDTGEGIFRSQIQTSMKTEKTVKHKVLVEATKEHRAEIEKWNEDVPVGRIERTHFSGMISPARKSHLLARTDALLRGVKKARMRANTVEVKDLDIGTPIFAYLFA